MKLRYIIAGIIAICLIILAVLVAMGPSLSLQTPPIETKAMDYLNKMHFLQANETLKAYKATSYYNYDSGIVVTDSRVFAFHKDQVFSIPLDKITMVMIKSSSLGHQQVLISAEADGVIDFEIYHTDVDKLITILGVPNSMVKEFAKQDIKEAKEQEKMQEKAQEMAPAVEATPTPAPVVIPDETAPNAQ